MVLKLIPKNVLPKQQIILEETMFQGKYLQLIIHNFPEYRFRTMYFSDFFESKSIWLIRSQILFGVRTPKIYNLCFEICVAS